MRLALLVASQPSKARNVDMHEEGRRCFRTVLPLFDVDVDVAAAARHGLYLVQVLQSGAQQTLQPTEADLYRQTVETASGYQDNLTQNKGIVILLALGTNIAC